MSRYLLLFLLNAPLILAGILGVITQYKLNKATRRRLVAQIAFWLIILAGLLIAQPLYEWLYGQELTQTESLSLFDVIQITAIVVIFYIVNRTRTKLENTERRLQDLHQELSITLAENTVPNSTEK